MSLTVTVRRPGHPERVEQALPGTRILTPTGLLHDLLDWLDRGKSWDDIDPGVRQFVATDLRALADIIEPEPTPISAATRRYSSTYGTGHAPGGTA